MGSECCVHSFMIPSLKFWLEGIIFMVPAKVFGFGQRI